MEQQQIFRVLVVDDEFVLRETMEKILVSQGFNVMTAEDGASAISITKDNDVDAALLDVKLPDINGVELLKKIKGLKPNVKVIMMTAYVVEELITRAFQEGAHSCLHKPFEINMLLKMLNELKNNDR